MTELEEVKLPDALSDLLFDKSITPKQRKFKKYWRFLRFQLICTFSYAMMCLRMPDRHSLL